jgi:uncharacterized lipoprotein YmbA
MYLNRIVFIQLAVLLSSLSGCVGTTPPAQFYLLEPIVETGATAASAAKRPLIALSPVRIPEYVDRPQIVTATGKNAYHLSEFDRWAEPLNDNIARVLQQNLAALVPAEVVKVNASRMAKEAQLRVSVNILEFHVDPQQQARLTAQWQIVRGNTMVASRQVSYQTPAAEDTYPAKVAALNTCLLSLSRDLAAALQRAAVQ